MVSLPAVTALGVGSVMIYGGLTGKSTFAVVREIMTGGNPASVANTNAIETAAVTGSPGGTGGTPNGQPVNATGVVGQIVTTFYQNGASKAQTAGALGNIQVETAGTFDPSIINSREGAIGLCQWEGGRRTRLQEYASHQKTTETDLQTQIDFIWQELHGSESAAYIAWKATSTPSAAASIWDALYERSDGSTRQKRIDAAIHWFGVI